MTERERADYEEPPTKDFMIAAMLSLFLGVFGIDRFYLARVVTGIFKLLTAGGFGIWYVIDLILILSGNMKDNFNQPLQNRKKNLKLALIITGVVFILSIGLSGYGNTEDSRSTGWSTSSSVGGSGGEPLASSSDAQNAESASMGERNALRSAQQYLRVSPFSQSGLKQQLLFEGFSEAEASYGVERIDADWNQQAARAAKQYLSVQSFPRSGLIEQLQFEGFTRSQAEFGADAVGY
jgi:hypothetical protein